MKRVESQSVGNKSILKRVYKVRAIEGMSISALSALTEFILKW
jgi:hypothetical protein